MSAKITAEKQISKPVLTKDMEIWIPDISKEAQKYMKSITMSENREKTMNNLKNIINLSLIILGVWSLVFY